GRTAGERREMLQCSNVGIARDEAGAEAERGWRRGRRGEEARLLVDRGEQRLDRQVVVERGGGSGAKGADVGRVARRRTAGDGDGDDNGNGWPSHLRLSTSRDQAISSAVANCAG